MRLRDQYDAAQMAVRKIQESLYGPPIRKEIDKSVNKIIKSYHLQNTSVERYFYLWAVCTLLGKEPLYSFWKQRPGYKAKAEKLYKRIRMQEKRNVSKLRNHS